MDKALLFFRQRRELSNQFLKLRNGDLRPINGMETIAEIAS
jgi:hypothetical protein